MLSHEGAYYYYIDYLVLIFIATSLKSTVVRNCSCLQMYINNITSLKLYNRLGESCIGCFCSEYYHVLMYYETVYCTRVYREIKGYGQWTLHVHTVCGEY